MSLEQDGIDDLRNDYYSDAGLKRVLSAVPVLFYAAEDALRLRTQVTELTQLLRDTQERIARLSVAHPQSVVAANLWQWLDDEIKAKLGG